MEELLKAIGQCRWYHVLILAGAGLVFLALTSETQWLTNQEVGTLGAGLFWLGLGSWRAMRPKVEKASVGGIPGIAKYKKFQPDLIDWAMLIGGLCLLLRFAYVVFKDL